MVSFFIFAGLLGKPKSLVVISLPRYADYTGNSKQYHPVQLISFEQERRVSYGNYPTPESTDRGIYRPAAAEGPEDVSACITARAALSVQPCLRWLWQDTASPGYS